MINRELKSVIEKLIAAELGPREGRYELLYLQEPKSKSSIKVIAVDEMQEDLPKPMQYHSRFASMLARKSLSELIQPEMIPDNISKLQVSIIPMAQYQFRLSLDGLDSILLAGYLQTNIGYYNGQSRTGNAQDISNVISVEPNSFKMTIADSCIILYLPRLYDENRAKSKIIESSIHETVHAMTLPIVIREILGRTGLPVNIDYLIFKLKLPYELVAHALTPYIYRKYTKDNKFFETYSEDILKRASNENKSYCDYSAVSEILSNNKTIEDAFDECIDRIRLDR